MGSLLHADSMEIAATAKSICFTNRRGFTMNLQITQVITIGIIQGKPALLTSILLRLVMHGNERAPDRRSQQQCSEMFRLFLGDD